MKKNICVLPGDGIGPEVTAQALKVLDAVADKFGHVFEYEQALIGGSAIDACGEPLPQATLDLCRKSDAVFLGAVGGPKWDKGGPRPEAGLLAIRKGLGLFANLRPVLLYPELLGGCPLKPERVAGGVDMLIVRELTGDVYFGQPAGRGSEQGLRTAFNNMIYREDEIERIAHLAFRLAQSRGKRLCSVDKANVLEVSRLWREVVIEVAVHYPDVELSHLYIDNAAMQLILRPGDFDVILTANLFGDILSDEAAVVSGSIGMLPSASLGEAHALYEPIHGSAPDIAGRDIANPMASVLSAAMLLRHSFALKKEAGAVERAVSATLAEGFRTGDIMEAGMRRISCTEAGDIICKKIMEQN
ncbi:MAG: 3-isopropylmalate dehydrogenase [Desulfovibrionaceae bacterium]|nr:3-isopropylmalate dehydrogenase [Desulfovibrionaceae bacterium]